MKSIKELGYYSLNIISGIIFILSIPNEEAKNFLEIYSISSGFISIIIVYSLSKKYLTSKFKLIIILLSATGLITSIYDKKIGLIVGYALAAISVDYIATQVYIEQRNKIRMISFLFNAVLLFGLMQILMGLRILLGMILLLAMIKNNKIPETLNINKAELVIIKSNGIYYGVLYLIAKQNLVNLQLIYVLIQIGLSFALKIYDYRSRQNSSITNGIYILLKLIGVMPAIVILWFTNDIQIVFVYILAYVFLIRLEKLI